MEHDGVRGAQNHCTAQARGRRDSLIRSGREVERIEAAHQASTFIPELNMVCVSIAIVFARRLELWGWGSESGGLSVDKVLGHHSDTSAGHLKGCIASVSGTLVLQSAMKPSVGLQWRVQC